MPSSACKTCALRSEEHTSELQSHSHLVCRLLLENIEMATANRQESEMSERPIGEVAKSLTADRSLLFFNETATTEIYTLSLHDALPINDTATTEIYTLSLHDALPISVVAVS